MPCVFGERVYTGRKVVEKAFVCFSGSRVTAVAARRQGEVVGEFAVITPAFIDPHSHIGMHRAGEPSGEGEANEKLDTVLALADALDSVQMDDAALRESVECGVLYSCVVPGSGNVLGGRSAVIRNGAPDTTSALVRRAGIKACSVSPQMAHSAS